MLTFQIIDLSSYSEEDDDNVDKFKIELFGKTKDDKTVYVRVDGFFPYFYVKISKKLTKTMIDMAISKVKNSIYKDHKGALKRYTVEQHHIFNEFTNYKLFRFLKVEFHNYEGFRKYAYAFKKHEYELYESNLEPMLRFMHHQNIKPCGWVQIANPIHFQSPVSLTDIAVSVNYRNISPVIDDNTISKLIIASFDIECYSEDGNTFPQATNDNDAIIQIATTFNRYGEIDCFYKSILVLGSCDPIDGVDVFTFETEKELLLAWAKLIRDNNPDIITGYNIFGFDYPYIRKRTKKLGIRYEFTYLSKLIEEQSIYTKKELSSAAYGDNILKFYEMKGRVQIDLLKVLQRDPMVRLESYKLDNVASEFIKEKVEKIQINPDNTSTIYTKSHYGLTVERYIKLNYQDGFTINTSEHKYLVIDMGKEDNYCTITIKGILETAPPNVKVTWSQAKDDLDYKVMFQMHKGTSADRAVIAKYCINDAVLCNKLLEKLQILTNNISMANVCSVPLSYIFLRGQSIKIFSLVARESRLENILIKELPKPPKPDLSKMTPKEKRAFLKAEKIANGYEGATVIKPKPGIYYDPIPVLDYASLYPRSMIGKSISHDRLVRNPKYDNLPGYKYHNVEFNNKDGTTTLCRFAENIAEPGKIGILTKILINLLEARENTRSKQKHTKDVFMWRILEGLQLAFKVTANSLYGQTGAAVSPIYNKYIAASTTATGRNMLFAAKKFTEEYFTEFANEKDHQVLTSVLKTFLDINPMFPDIKVGLSDEEKEAFIKKFITTLTTVMQDRKIKPYCVYGDTDSIFMNYVITDEATGTPLNDKDTLGRAIKLGILTGDLYNIIVPSPHNLEYEKTFYPYIIHTKKRYVGNLYTFNPDIYYLKSMGIVLVRRDNAPIVKIVVGGIVNKILEERDSKAAVDFCKNELRKILGGYYKIDKFILSKNLKAVYANRDSQAHVVLADRLKQRDPGNAPQINDRIQYVYVTDYDRKYKNKYAKKQLQCDKVEDPQYILENNLHIDYLYYITNQIQKPASQFLEYIIKDVDKFFANYITRGINHKQGKKHIKSFFGMMGNEEGGGFNDWTV